MGEARPLQTLQMISFLLRSLSRIRFFGNGVDFCFCFSFVLFSFSHSNELLQGSWAREFAQERGGGHMHPLSHGGQGPLPVAQLPRHGIEVSRTVSLSKLFRFFMRSFPIDLPSPAKS